MPAFFKVMMNLNNKYKTVICKHFQQTGRCNLGQRCHFAHGPEELRNPNDPIPAGQIPSSQPPRPFQNTPSPSGPATVANFKTIKCKFFEQGQCKYESKCTFAHGDQDVRIQQAGMALQSTAPAKQPTRNAQATPGSYNQSNPQNQVIQQQIYFLIQNLEQHHRDNMDYLVILKKATEINNTGDSQTAASLVYNIINRTNKTAEEDDYYQSLLEDLQNYGTYLYQQIQSSYPQQQASSPSTYSGYGAQPTTTSPSTTASSIGSHYQQSASHMQPSWQQHQQHPQHQPHLQHPHQHQQQQQQQLPQSFKYSQQQPQGVDQHYSYDNHYTGGQTPELGNGSMSGMSGITQMMGGMNLSSGYGQQAKPYNGQVKYQQAGGSHEDYA